ncbi:MAG: hypothetical protein ACYS72_01605 [Planctomycetota bacterium]
MLSHPITFLVGYLVVTFIIAFAGLGPLTVLVMVLSRRRMQKPFVNGVYLGSAITAWGFMILHYLLYLRGYGISDWSTLFGDIFYPTQYF